MMVLVLVRDFLVGCPGVLAASQACYVTDRWFTPHFSVLARFRIDAWMADVSCPVACQHLWPACWLDTPDRSSSSSSRVVQDVWDVYRDVLGVVSDEVVRALRDAASRSAVDDFWSIWSRNAEAGFFRAYPVPLVFFLVFMRLKHLVFPPPLFASSGLLL